MTPNFVLEIAARAAKTPQGRSAIEEIQVYWDKDNAYSEPGYAAETVALGDWNTITRYIESERRFEYLDDTPRRLGDILERMGVEIEWSDEWSNCGDCGRLVRTSPDSYGWTPSYVFHPAQITCHDCIDPAEHLEELEGEDGNCNTLDLSPGDHGYDLIRDGFEHGFHPGQHADPKRIAKLLREIGCERFVFNMDSVGQFDQRFSVWLHGDERELLPAAKHALETGETDGPSVAAAMERGLREAGKAADALQGDGVRYVQIQPDGSVKARMVPPDEFVAGIKDDD